MITEILLLIAFTIIVYICLLYFAKYLWVLFTATNVGQTYAQIYEDNYRLTNDILNKNFIGLAAYLTLTSCVICFIAGAILKFLHLIRYFYSDRGVLSRIILIGLPLTFIVAVCMYYTGDFNHMDTAYTVSFVPTLCVFTGCFKFAEEFVPALFDIIYFFSGKDETNDGKRNKERVLNGAQGKDTTQSKTVMQTVSQDIRKSLKTYFTVTLVIISVAGILMIMPQIQKFIGTEASKHAKVAVDTTLEQKPEPVTGAMNVRDRFVAYPDKTVLDTETGLMWAARESETLSWHDAKKYCQKYHGGGHKDWRMPTIAELEGLYDPGRQPDCGSVTHLIEMEEDTCWEWSSKTKDSDAAFFAFNLNGMQWLPKSNNSSVRIRPVRAGK